MTTRTTPQHTPTQRLLDALDRIECGLEGRNFTAYDGVPIEWYSGIGWDGLDDAREAASKLQTSHAALVEALEPFANVNKQGRCRSCGCELEPVDFYCGCPPEPSAEYAWRISARAALAAAKGTK